MSEFPLFCYFYHRPAVPIGKIDLAGLEKAYMFARAPHEFTHWLIALLWHEEESRGWKVMVYTVTEQKAFWSVPAFYQSNVPTTFEKAWKLSERIKTLSEQDRLISMSVQPDSA